MNIYSTPAYKISHVINPSNKWFSTNRKFCIGYTGSEWLAPNILLWRHQTKSKSTCYFTKCVDNYL